MTGRVPCIFLASRVPRLYQAIRNILPSYELNEVKIDNEGKITDADKAVLLEKVEILFADLPVISEIVGKAPKLKWAQSTWAGVETIIKSLPQPPDGVTITRMGNGFGSLMAEYVLGQIISRERFFTVMLEAQKRSVWDKSKVINIRPLSSLTAGILGVGQIGTEIARLLRSVGMTTWGLGRNERKHKPPEFNVVKTSNDMTEFLQSCDYLINVLPSTASTKNLLSGNTLKQCNKVSHTATNDRNSVLVFKSYEEIKSPCFINVGRGDIIDDESLLKALKNGWLSGAILDVVNQEPLPQDSPLWSTPNVVITPHISGPCLAEPLADVFARNLSNYLEGKPLDYEIKWDVGY